MSTCFPNGDATGSCRATVRFQGTGEMECAQGSGGDVGANSFAASSTTRLVERLQTTGLTPGRRTALMANARCVPRRWPACFVYDRPADPIRIDAIRMSAFLASHQCAGLQVSGTGSAGAETSVGSQIYRSHPASRAARAAPASGHRRARRYRARRGARRPDGPPHQRREVRARRRDGGKSHPCRLQHRRSHVTGSWQGLRRRPIRVPACPLHYQERCHRGRRT